MPSLYASVLTTEMTLLLTQDPVGAKLLVVFLFYQNSDLTRMSWAFTEECQWLRLHLPLLLLKLWLFEDRQQEKWGESFEADGKSCSTWSIKQRSENKKHSLLLRKWFWTSESLEIFQGFLLTLFWVYSALRVLWDLNVDKIQMAPWEPTHFYLCIAFGGHGIPSLNKAFWGDMTQGLLHWLLMCRLKLTLAWTYIMWS